MHGLEVIAPQTVVHGSITDTMQEPVRSDFDSSSLPPEPQNKTAF